jgi:MarR family transcriptional regulator, transcriptional regulator for hemolysin
MDSLDLLRRTLSTTLVLAARQWRSKSHGALVSCSVSGACAAPLITANRLGGAVRQVTLAAHIGIEGPSLVRLLDQLCSSGLVRRDVDPDDRRAKTITLTDEGRAITARIEDCLIALRARQLEGVTHDELKTALRVLNVFSAPPDTSSVTALEGVGETEKPA